MVFSAPQLGRPVSREPWSPSGHRKCSPPACFPYQTPLLQPALILSLQPPRSSMAPHCLRNKVQTPMCDACPSIYLDRWPCSSPACTTAPPLPGHPLFPPDLDLFLQIRVHYSLYQECLGVGRAPNSPVHFPPVFEASPPAASLKLPSCTLLQWGGSCAKYRAGASWPCWL